MNTTIKFSEKLKKYFKKPHFLLYRFFCNHPSWFNDELYLRIKFKFRMGYSLPLSNPITFNEKLQWLKLYNRNPNYTTLVDKIAVKEWVSKKIGNDYIIPTIAIYNNISEIDWNSLPKQFVIKCNHDSGGIIICKDKSKFDIVEAKKKLYYHTSHDNYSITREWPYKNIKRKIFCEKYFEDKDTSELRDYKFFCFDGEPKVMFIATDRNSPDKEVKFDYFDMTFKRLDIRQSHPNSDITFSKPTCFEEMKHIAAVLSKGIPHVRVDLYEVNKKVFFGEMTFFHFGGFTGFDPPEWDYTFGEWIKLPQKK